MSNNKCYNYDGPTGSQGMAGSKGSPGCKGSTGPRGVGGLRGSQGPVGPKGYPGPTGSCGADGLKGLVGCSGDKGTRGFSGMIGPTGPCGSVGPIGDNGCPGPRGYHGPVGCQGSTGPSGPEGPVGHKGDNGWPGPRGCVGPTGYLGMQGTDGCTGPRGPRGIQGPEHIPCWHMYFSTPYYFDWCSVGEPAYIGLSTAICSSAILSTLIDSIDYPYIIIPSNVTITNVKISAYVTNDADYTMATISNNKPYSADILLNEIIVSNVVTGASGNKNISSVDSNIFINSDSRISIKITPAPGSTVWNASITLKYKQNAFI
jgi:hypothetical protein